VNSIDSQTAHTGGWYRDDRRRLNCLLLILSRLRCRGAWCVVVIMVIGSISSYQGLVWTMASLRASLVDESALQVTLQSSIHCG